MSDKRTRIDIAMEGVVFALSIAFVAPILIGLWRWALG